MNLFDITIIMCLNRFSQLSWTADSMVRFIAMNHLIKGGILMGIFWWGWFKINKNRQIVRVHLIAGLYSCFVAMVFARVLALSLPFRLRPLHEEGLGFILPHSMKPTILDGWSSFPSDHAVLFYAISTAMFYISKKAGNFAIAYTTLVIGLPRIYLGLHYPTDIIAGAFIGIGIALLFQSSCLIDKVSRPTLKFSNSEPGIFYALLFTLTYQICDMFDNSRSFLLFLVSILKPVFT
jgi:undecaprenyl-diphosphatase